MKGGKCSETQTIIRRHLLRAYARFISLSSLPNRRFPLCGRSHARNLLPNAIDYYKGEEIRPWLFTIAYNAFIDWYRKEKKYNTTTGDEFHLPNVPSTEHEYFVKHEIASWLDRLSSLPLERRNALLLRDYYGFSYKEIAEMTGLSLAKVKIELHRGRKEIKSIKE